MTDILLIFLAFLTAATVNANATTAVTVHQPLNNQLPLIARVGQPYSWTISPSTFSYSGGLLNYSTSTLPRWLSFDEVTQTFHGTPSAGDEGYPEITVTARAGGSSVSTRCTICVTHAPEPKLRIPLERQFTSNSTSLSSVYFPRENSAIATPNPAVRIPRKWSFSIGLETETFAGASKIYYELRLANGSELPDYLDFNSKTVTLDGIIPSAEKITQPSVVSCVLHASDQEGYTAALLPFDLLIADHELSRSVKSMPTINITMATPFVLTLSSAVDFTGILVDGEPIQPANISSLDIDISNYGQWLRYDKSSRTLSGTPGDDVTGTTPLLPVNLTTTFNQSITTNVSLNLVESYFVLPVLPSIQVSKGDRIQTALTPWFSKSNSRPGYDGTSVIASFEPVDAADFLQFDESSTNLTGTIPLDYHLGTNSLTVSFTAYSNITHTTSHTSLTIHVTDSTNTKSLAPTRPDVLNDEARKKLILALALSFGLVGGLCVLAGIFAVVRRWAKVEDTAVVGEEGRRAWSDKDRRWYGMTLSPNQTRVVEKQDATTTANDQPKPRGPRPNYGGLGLGRVSERSQANTDSQEHLVSPGVMKKKEFLARIKETVRQVSNKYARKQGADSKRPAIGKPILVSSIQPSANQPDVIVQSSSSNPFDNSIVPRSTFMSGSPSGSTAEQSIPRRRADFDAPRNPPQVHFKSDLLLRHASTGSTGGVSYRSGKSGVSGDSLLETAMGPPTRPRLVPFTSSTRVPVPDAENGAFTGNRMVSQRAKVCKTDSNSDYEDTGTKPSGTVDELSMGLHYMRSLGTDQPAVNDGGGGGNGSSMSNVRSSFTSLESSHVGHKTGTELSVTKVLVRAGERFKFRVPVFPMSGTTAASYHVRLISGQPLPRFVQPDLSGITTKGVLELSGVATFRDLGELSIGVYTEANICVANIVIEVVGRP